MRGPQIDELEKRWAVMTPQAREVALDQIRKDFSTTRQGLPALLTSAKEELSKFEPDYSNLDVAGQLAEHQSARNLWEDEARVGARIKSGIFTNETRVAWARSAQMPVELKMLFKNIRAVKYAGFEKSARVGAEAAIESILMKAGHGDGTGGIAAISTARRLVDSMRAGNGVEIYAYRNVLRAQLAGASLEQKRQVEEAIDLAVERWERDPSPLLQSPTLSGAEAFGGGAELKHLLARSGHKTFTDFFSMRRPSVSTSMHRSALRLLKSKVKLL